MARTVVVERLEAPGRGNRVFASVFPRFPGARSGLASVVTMDSVQRHLDNQRHLPALAASSFYLTPGEPIGPGLQRLSLDQLKGAVDAIRGGRHNVDDAIHQARKSVKRLRAILRLVRPEVGERVYRYENRALRNASRLVADVRSSAVAVETVGRLSHRFSGSLPVDVFDDVGERLDRRALKIKERVLEDGDALGRLAASLERAQFRFAGWPMGEDERKVYGTAIRDRFSSVGPGLAATYRQGRDRMDLAVGRPDATRHHEWRKSVKYLRYQVEVMSGLWPEVLGPTAAAMDRLGAYLGDENDLAELLRLLTVEPGLCPDPVERSLLAALAQHRRHELQKSAQILGMRVFAEKPGQFVGRMATYWKANRVPVEVGVMVEG